AFQAGDRLGDLRRVERKKSASATFPGAPIETKLQAPISKPQRNSKSQASKRARSVFGVWCFSGAWSSDVGALCAAVFDCFRRGTRKGLRCARRALAKAGLARG